MSRPLLWLCGLLVVPTMAWAGPAEDLEAALAGGETVTARFTQTLVSKGFGAAGTWTGTLSIKRPGKMRWDYDEPRGKTVVADGTWIWAYDPEQKTVYRQPEANQFSPRSPALFLAGLAPLGETFDIEPATRKNEGGAEETVFRLLPKRPQPGLKGMLVALDANGRLARLTVVDHLGAKNRFAFTDVAIDVALPDRLFDFTPPHGARVIDAVDGDQKGNE
jgi:outer membrane lipoprotein carrier protein